MKLLIISLSHSCRKSKDDRRAGAYLPTWSITHSTDNESNHLSTLESWCKMWNVKEFGVPVSAGRCFWKNIPLPQKIFSKNVLNLFFFSFFFSTKSSTNLFCFFSTFVQTPPGFHNSFLHPQLHFSLDLPRNMCDTHGCFYWLIGSNLFSPLHEFTWPKKETDFLTCVDLSSLNSSRSQRREKSTSVFVFHISPWFVLEV